MRLRLLFVLLFVTATLVTAPGTACACDCATREPAELVRTSAAVFTGTLVSARRLEGDPLGPRPPIIYTFRADQVYKGQANAVFEVATNADEASCGYHFLTGSRYLVFASTGESGLLAVDPGVALHTSLCAGNRMVRPGGDPLRPEDGTQSGEPLATGLITALGAATRPPVTAAIPRSGDSAGRPAPLWIYAATAMAVLVLAFAGWRISRRRRP